MAGRITRSAQRFAATEASSSRLLLAATVIALLWANSPWADSYYTFWHTEMSMTLADHTLALDLRHWVNDGLMVFFFFALGLEVKRELVMGELADPRRAVIPFVAAVTGLAAPALIYWLINRDGAAAGAWGVVISTDTAFLMGVLALIGPACPGPLRLFLLTLAVADDVGALAVIALFYTTDLAVGPLLGAALGIGGMLLLRRLHVRRGPPYFVLGVVVWLAMYQSGVHPTIAGVVIALLAPAYPARREEVAEAAELSRSYSQSPTPQSARRARRSINRSVSAAENLQLLYQPWASLVIVPIFALANAGVTLSSDALAAAASSPVTLGVIAALVLGKLIGIVGGAALAVRLRIGTLAEGLGWLQLAGGAALSGIGFTISLFIVDLAFTDEELADQARIGILTAALVAVLLGSGLFAAARRFGPRPPARATTLNPPVDPDHDHVVGPGTAHLSLVEYGDYECPFCGQATGSVHEVQRYFGERLRYTYRHLPLTEVHPNSYPAAQAVEAAGMQGRFWEMHDRLFAHHHRLTHADLVDHAARLGLDPERFVNDLYSAHVLSKVEADIDSAAASGAQGTPTFYVNGERHTGTFDAPTLIHALQFTRAR